MVEMVKKHRKKKISLGILVVLAAGVFGWSVHRLIYQFIGDVLLNFGIVNEYAQNIVVIVIMGGILLLAGKHLIKYL